MALTVAMPAVYVGWGCRRCGHTGGVARTTLPVPAEWPEAYGRVMFLQLRHKLVRVHQKSGCIATPDDFHFYPYRKPGQDVLGKI